jgi:4-diphosphocytidyl-2-C-methyl-D-erythritol kinase
VSTLLAERAAAKINLTLRVVGRREDGYHLLESLVGFADLADTLSLQADRATALEISGPFAQASGPTADNLVLKAVATLRDSIPGLKSGRFSLEKHIPVAAGIGGGSADAAAALRLLARLNGIALNDPRLMAAALLTGADVPVCLDPRSRIMRGVGDILSEPLNMPPLSVVLANPRVPLPTQEVFAAFTGSQGAKTHLSHVPSMHEAMIGFLGQHGNDLTQAAIARAPAVAETLVTMRALPGVKLVRMSGSGPTCFALFRSPGEAAAAARRLAVDRKDWWVRAAKIG